VRFTGFEQERLFRSLQSNHSNAKILPQSKPKRSRQGSRALFELKTKGRELPEKVDRYLSDLNDIAMLSDLMTRLSSTDPLRRHKCSKSSCLISDCVLSFNISAKKSEALLPESDDRFVRSYRGLLPAGTAGLTISR